MERIRLHSNAWEYMHYMQEDYEMAHFMSISEYLEDDKTDGVYSTNEGKWLPTSCSNCYSISHLVEECLLLPTMMQPTPSYIFRSYDHQVVGCPTLQAIREELMGQGSQYKPQSNTTHGNPSTSIWSNRSKPSWIQSQE